MQNIPVVSSFDRGLPEEYDFFNLGLIAVFRSVLYSYHKKEALAK
jgi:hypothetical protein